MFLASEMKTKIQVPQQGGWHLTIADQQLPFDHYYKAVREEGAIRCKDGIEIVDACTAAF
jgi:hypothetical protein